LRIVLDLDHEVIASATSSVGNAAGSHRISVRLASPAAARVLGEGSVRSRKALVTIDPGHGGKDPGAISTSVCYEKEVALSIAHKLHDRLNGDTRFQASLTRRDDHFIPLRERVHIAHQQGADLFVSIHADAAPNVEAQGASVFVLSKDGATSAMASWLAESENSADRYATARDSALYSPDPMLSKVLVDMSMDATIAASLGLGEIMADSLAQVTRMHQQAVDQAGFAVLKSPDIPSILVETGFMSNRDDCIRLMSEHHQDELALALQQGVTNYFRRHPPLQAFQGKS
jgi:N-acetylmuramoyl-L-alanine amidase